MDKLLSLGKVSTQTTGGLTGDTTDGVVSADKGPLEVRLCADSDASGDDPSVEDVVIAPAVLY